MTPIDTPAFLAGHHGETIVEIDCPNVQTLETFCRSFSRSLGGNAACIFNTMRGVEAKKAIARNTVSQALTLGQNFLEGSMIADVVVQGIIERVLLERDSGFLRGTIDIRNDESMVSVEVCNEFMAVKNGSRMLAYAPDITTMIENRTIVRV